MEPPLVTHVGEGGAVWAMAPPRFGPVTGQNLPSRPKIFYFYNSIFLTSQIYENVTAHALTQGISTFPGSRLEGLRLSLITNITHNRNYSLIVLCLSKISLSLSLSLSALSLSSDLLYPHPLFNNR